MVLLTSARINSGDIIFQLLTFSTILAIPLGIIAFVVVYRRNNRLKRVEEKLDQLFSDKENRKS